MHVCRTGVGKTQLSLDLAEWIKTSSHELHGFKSAEIINADSMQVYRGTDIITNKASDAERTRILHHLIDFLDVGQDYRVDRFIADALQTVSTCSLQIFPPHI